MPPTSGRTPYTITITFIIIITIIIVFIITTITIITILLPYYYYTVTVSFHNFKSQNSKLSVSNPKSRYFAYVCVLSRISNCPGLGRKNKHEILKTDHTALSLLHLRSDACRATWGACACYDTT